jgi:ubiquinone/menaquinone biosynthesis C-methylase UbiE
MPRTNKTTLFNIKEILSKMKIGERQHVAELGCGNFGFFVFPLAYLVGHQGIVYALDILKPTLEEISKEAKLENLPQIKTVWSNLEIFKAAKIETNSIDSALLVNVLHQSEKRVEILREAVRLLKRGGKLLIVEGKNIDLPFGPKPEKRIKLDSLKMAVPKIGLNIKEEFEAGPYHYGLILTKL